MASRPAEPPRRAISRRITSAALKMKVEDLRPRGAGWTIPLHEKGGKHHLMPCHHALAEALHAYINAAGIAEDRTRISTSCWIPTSKKHVPSLT